MNQGALCSTFQKFFEIKVNDDAVARGNVLLRLGYCLMGRAPRSEAVTVPGKRWVPAFLQNLQQGLLDQWANWPSSSGSRAGTSALST